jgi:hypothetical protein
MMMNVRIVARVLRLALVNCVVPVTLVKLIVLTLRTGKILSFLRIKHMTDKISIPADVWAQVEKTSMECKQAWGMGFPVISVTLLKKILKRQYVDKPGRSINRE